MNAPTWARAASLPLACAILAWSATNMFHLNRGWYLTTQVMAVSMAVGFLTYLLTRRRDASLLAAALSVASPRLLEVDVYHATVGRYLPLYVVATLLDAAQWLLLPLAARALGVGGWAAAGTALILAVSPWGMWGIRLKWECGMPLLHGYANHGWELAQIVVAITLATGLTAASRRQRDPVPVRWIAVFGIAAAAGMTMGLAQCVLP